MSLLTVFKLENDFQLKKMKLLNWVLRPLGKN